SWSPTRATTRSLPSGLHLAHPRRRTKSHASSGSRCSRRKRSEEHTSELQSRENLVCRLLLEKKKGLSAGARRRGRRRFRSRPDEGGRCAPHRRASDQADGAAVADGAALLSRVAASFGGTAIT